MAVYVKPVPNEKTCSKCGARTGPDHHWYVLASDGESEISGPHESRGDAKADAIDQAGDDAVVLLRADGSVYGEMRPAEKSGDLNSAQLVQGETASDGAK